MHVRRKTTFANIHVKNMTHVTELELKTRAFAPPFVHIPFIPVGRTKECQECAKILLQVGSSAVRFKNVPLTTESKTRSCSPAIKYSRCNHLLKSFSRLGAKIWNSIPQELRKVSKFVFKANLQNLNLH